MTGRGRKGWSINPADHKRRKGDGGYFKPTQQQDLLLRAALREGKEAIDAWREWHASVDIDRLDLSTQRLLPLVYRNLWAQAATEPGLGRLKGIYRHVWYKNQILLHAMAASLRALHDAGIETLILKGAALISCYYKDSGSRPMEDFDVLVRAEQASAAIGVLRDAGWRPKDSLVSEPVSERQVPFRYAAPFADAAGRKCDLHFHVLPESIQAGGDDGFWEAAIPATIGGMPTRALSPADQLLHVCVHGARWDVVPPVRWIPDAVTIVNVATTSGEGVDWHHLTTQTRKLRLTLPLRDALGYLRETWDVAVPPAVLRSLQETPVSRVERIEHAARIRPKTVPNVVLHYWAQNSRLVGDAGVVHRLVRFPAYLRGVWGLKHYWQLPLRAAYAAVRLLRSKRG